MKIHVAFMTTQTQPTPIPIEHGVPIAWRTCLGFDTTAERLRQTISKMKPMDSIYLTKMAEYREAYRSAQQVGAVILSRKVREGGWRIWRMQ